MKLRITTALKYVVITLILVGSGWLFGTNSYPEAKVSFKDFKSLVSKAEKHRQQRLINLDEFLEMAEQDGVIILDTRSKLRFDRIHVKGATHLNFSDFTQDNLSEIIPSPDTTILIYCNNNFEGNQVDFTSKVFVPPTVVATQFAEQEKPLMMALNIPTYINLYGYGYKNVFELNELVDVDDPRISFEGSILD